MCCVMLRCVVLLYWCCVVAVLCYAVVCCAVLWCGVVWCCALRCAALRCVVLPCCAVLSCAVLTCAVLCCAGLRCACFLLPPSLLPPLPPLSTFSACTAPLLSGTFLCLLLLLWVLLLLLFLLFLVGNFGPLQLHASTTFKNVRASRSLLRQVFLVGSGRHFFSFFFRSFFARRFSKVFLRFWRGFEAQNGCQFSFLDFFCVLFSGGVLESIFSLFF